MVNHRNFIKLEETWLRDNNIDVLEWRSQSESPQISIQSKSMEAIEVTSVCKR